MITDAANKLAEKITELQLSYENMAQNNAIEFARNEKPESKIGFQKYSAIAEVYREMHLMTCEALHKVEAEMRSKCTEVKDSK